MMSIQIKRQLMIDISIRVILWLLFLWLDHIEPFIRVIRYEEIWMYQYPVTPSYVPSNLLWLIVFIIPSSIFLFDYMKNGNIIELKQVVLSLTLNYGLVGFMTQYFKIIVGRPRPDFYYRCFPDGKGTDFNHCTGDKKSYMDGRKSFPSGHSSFAFASMFFVSLYLTGKFKIFNDNGRGCTWRLCACILPLIIAASIAISRTCDYHHHWQDVLTGCILGSTAAYICYRQYYPSVFSANSDIPYVLHNSGFDN